MKSLGWSHDAKKKVRAQNAFFCVPGFPCSVEIRSHSDDAAEYYDCLNVIV